MSTSARRLLLLSDGKAGHVSTSRGMAELARSEAAVEVVELAIRLRAKFLRPLLRWLVNSGLAGRLDRPFGPGWPALFYRGYRPETADAVLSTGGDTLYLNAIEGHWRGRPNIFCGSMRGVDPALFSHILHTRAADLPNWQAMEVLPSAVRIDQAEQAAAGFADAHLGGRRDGCWALLIGGDGSGYRFGEADVVALLDHCVALAARHGKRLLVTTSRRTGAAAEQRLAAWLADHPEAPVAYAVLYGRRPERVAGAFMRLAELVFCTEESTSMISESVLHGRPVVALSAAVARPVPDHRDFLAGLAAKGRIVRVGVGQLDGLDVAGFLARWHPYEGADHERLRTRMRSLLG
jgi:mitochondrial fission protein ELM1